MASSLASSTQLDRSCLVIEARSKVLHQITLARFLNTSRLTLLLESRLWPFEETGLVLGSYRDLWNGGSKHFPWRACFTPTDMNYRVAMFQMHANVNPCLGALRLLLIMSFIKPVSARVRAAAPGHLLLGSAPLSWLIVAKSLSIRTLAISYATA